MTEKTLGDFDTCELVEELKKREGVKHYILGPDEFDSCLHEGPCVILKVID